MKTLEELKAVSRKNSRQTDLLRRYRSLRQAASVSAKEVLS